MKNCLLSLIGIMAFFAISCTQEYEGDALDSRAADTQELTSMKVTLNAFPADDEPETKTELNADGKFMWSPGDCINLIFDKGSGSLFQYNGNEPARYAPFDGTINVSFGFDPDAVDAPDLKFWGVYPYSQNNEVVETDGGGRLLHTVLPSVQYSGENTWGQGQAVYVGQSGNLAMGFRNVGGGVQFFFTEDGVKEIRLKGNNGEVLAGDVFVSMSTKGVPSIQSFGETQITEVSMKPADGETFRVSEGDNTYYYYVTLPPVNFTDGFTVTLLKESQQAVRTYSAREITRNHFATYTKPVNNNVTFSELPPLNNQIIYYASEEITDNTFLNGGTTQFANGRGVVTFTEDVAEIPAAAFANNTQLHRIILPESVTIIRDHAFKSCTNLTSVTVGSDATMGSSITEIENSAFFGCSSLADVVLPSVLTKLGAMAFGECTGLEGGMNIPSSLTAMAANPFYKCTGITCFTGKFVMSDGLFLCSQTILFSAALGSPALAEGECCYIPSQIEIIYFDALAGLQASSVSLGSSVKTLGDECFKDAANLSGQIRIPETVEMIYSNVFQGCTSLSSVLFSSDNLPEIDINAFGGGSGDEETNFMVQISGYSTIESADMLGTSGNYWNDYRIAGRIQVVQDYDEIWFHNNDNSNFSLEQGLDFGSEDSPATVITSTQTFKPKFFINDIRPYVLQLPFTIDDNTSICVQKVSDIIYKVPDNAFKERTTLDYVSIQKAEIIGDYAFEKTGLVYFPIANAYTRYLQSIGDYAFSECTDLVFGTANYFNLTSVTSLGEGAFNLCEAFGSTTEGFASRLHLGQVTEIPSYAFNGCKKLTQILINNSGSQSADAVNSITSIGREAFSGCENLAGIDSKANNSTRINLPGVTSVGNKAFANCASIDTVSLPVAISLGTSAFENCTILASISIPLVENLGSNCFKGQHKLTQLNLLAVKTIGSGALGNGTKSIEIGISQSVQSLTNSLFSPMELSQTLPRSVVLLMAKSDPPAISDDTFSNLNVRTGGEFKIRLRNETIRDSYLRAWKGYFPFKNLSSSDLELIFVYQ